jgi:hypothetical protein
VWGGALLASIVPHNGVSWQAHVCGAVGGVVAAWLLARPRGGDETHPPHPPGHRDLHESLDRALAQ